jgi:orotate phosphoribosyltransferase
MTKLELAKEIYQTCHLTGEFLLRSGTVSNEYFDKYLFEGQPRLLRAIVQHMLPLIPKDTEVLAGLEMGGIPVVTMLSHYSGIPAVFVRKKAKSYGTCKLAEGGEITGKKVLIIEDVVTSGGQILLSAKELRDLGAIIDTVLCVIDREAGGRENLAAANLTLHPLLTMTELKASIQTP